MILILGGTKSGKSSFASKRAEKREQEYPGSIVYLATARAGDSEMKERIKKHREERPSSWITVEEPEDPAAFFFSSAAEYGGENKNYKEISTNASTVLLDCITLWLTNLLEPFGEKPDRDSAYRTAEIKTSELIKNIADWESGVNTGKEVIIVSNLVETGLISPWPLGRIFQDIAGLTHQKLASAAEEVYLMTAGLPQQIKEPH